MDTFPRIIDGVQRLMTVFTEMPDARLTVTDAERLSGLDRVACERVLLALEDARVLRRGPGGRYQRRTTDSPDS